MTNAAQRLHGHDRVRSDVHRRTGNISYMQRTVKNCQMKKAELFESAVRRRESSSCDEAVSTILSVGFAALVIAAVVMSVVGCTPYF